MLSKEPASTQILTNIQDEDFAASLEIQELLDLIKELIEHGVNSNSRKTKIININDLFRRCNKIFNKQAKIYERLFISSLDNTEFFYKFLTNNPDVEQNILKDPSTALLLHYIAMGIKLLRKHVISKDTKNEKVFIDKLYKTIIDNRSLTTKVRNDALLKLGYLLIDESNHLDISYRLKVIEQIFKTIGNISKEELDSMLRKAINSHGGRFRESDNLALITHFTKILSSDVSWNNYMLIDNNGHSIIVEKYLANFAQSNDDYNVYDEPPANPYAPHESGSTYRIRAVVCYLSTLNITADVWYDAIMKDVSDQSSISRLVYANVDHNEFYKLAKSKQKYNFFYYLAQRPELCRKLYGESGLYAASLGIESFQRVCDMLCLNEDLDHCLLILAVKFKNVDFVLLVLIALTDTFWPGSEYFSKPGETTIQAIITQALKQLIADKVDIEPVRKYLQGYVDSSWNPLIKYRFETVLLENITDATVSKEAMQTLQQPIIYSSNMKKQVNQNGITPDLDESLVSQPLISVPVTAEEVSLDLTTPQCERHLQPRQNMR